MSPRTLITDGQIVDQDFVAESEINEFFGDVVITGTETNTSVVQSFAEYFVNSNILVPASGVTLVTGTNTIAIGSTGALSPDNFSYETIVSGVTITIPQYQQMIVNTALDVQSGGTLVVDGTLVVETPITAGEFVAASGFLRSLTLVDKALIGSSNITVLSGVSTITLIGAQPPAVVGGTNITVVSGSNIITVSSTATSGGGNAIVGGSNITVTSGVSTTTITAAQPPAIIAGGDITVVSGSNTVRITDNNRALLGSDFINVASGTNTITISADAIVAGSSNLAVSTGTNTVSIDLSSTPSVTTLTATTVTGTTGNFAGNLNAQNVNASVQAFGTTVSGGSGGVRSAGVVQGQSAVFSTSMQAETVTGTTGQFAGALSAQSAVFSTSATVSGVSLMHQGVNAITTSGINPLQGIVDIVGSGIINVKKTGSGKIEISAPTSAAGGGGIASVQADSNPVLGGNLNANSFNITGAGTISGTGFQTGGTVSAQNGSFSNELTVSGLPVLVKEVQSYQFFADQLSTPLEADWAVNSFAPLSVDTLNSGILNRPFDDTTEEGVGFSLELPRSMSTMTLRFRSRAQTAPGATRTVGLKLYSRSFPDNGSITNWGSVALADLSFPANTNWQYSEQTLTTGTLSIVGGRICQFELTRINPTAGTELVGDWNLMLLKVDVV